MMTEVEFALNLLMEECSEVIKACSKAKRFGPEHVWEKEQMTNAEAIRQEMMDVMFIAEKLQTLGVIGGPTAADFLARDEKYQATLRVSRLFGCVR